MKRSRATALLEDLLRRADRDEWPVSLVEAVYVFGSYARGAMEPGDVDVAVDFRRDRRWTSHFVHCLSYGKNPYAVFNKALRGSSRALSILYEREGHEDVPMTLLWSRGEAIDVALERVHSIPEDNSAGRASRDAMLPCFEGLDKWVPRFVREELGSLTDAGLITLDQVVLADAEVQDDEIASVIESRWIASSPLRRAASAAMAYLEGRGVDPWTVYLHGVDLGSEITPVSVGFEMRQFRSMLRIFDEYGGREWLEVVHPTRRNELRALRVALVDRALLPKVRRDPSSFFH